MTRVVTQNIENGRPLALDRAAYEARGGYSALRRALASMTPDQLRETVKDSGLRGRGGAGFPTGVKWSFVPRGADLAGRKVYLICNCDEMEPGSFKDRVLLFGDPHQLLEGMILAAYATGAAEGFLFVRHEYEEGAERFRRAVAEARAAGYLGERILGSGFSFQAHAHTSAGRYICGEETALINALEGKRANPRARPPFPPVAGLFAMPTVVQNVETLCCLPHILNQGADWFKGLARGRDAGTKLFTISGRVRRPGTYELPLGMPLKEILEEHCGGMREGYALRGVIPGGGSTPIVTAAEWEVAMDFTSLAEIGSRLGTGGIIVLDNRTCLVGVLRNLEHFYGQESCGWCTPCREGIPYIEHILAGLEEGRGEAGDIDLLAELAGQIGPYSFCALADGAMGPLVSALEKFRGEFERHVTGKSCPYEPPAWG